MRELEDFNIYLTPFSKRFKFLQEDKRRSFNLNDMIDIDDFLKIMKWLASQFWLRSYLNIIFEIYHYELPDRFTNRGHP